jgi:hypothetical protein
MKLRAEFKQRRAGFLLMELMLALVLMILSVLLVSGALGIIARQTGSLNLQLIALSQCTQSSTHDPRFIKKIEYEPVVIRWTAANTPNFSGCQWCSITIFEKVTNRPVLSMPDLKMD